MAQINKPNLHFNNVLYTGNGSARTITGVGFQPDWVWVKDRDSTNFHYLYDVVRGNNLNLYTNATDGDTNVTTALGGGGIGSQASDGFTIVAGTSNTNNVNTNSNNYISWNWKAGGAASANSSGTISSSVSVNTTAGFSIVSYTGNATAGATIGHGLGTTPSMMIIKRRNSGNSWRVYHKSIGATKMLTLSATSAATTQTNIFNDTEPTSSVFSVGDSSTTNASGGTYIAYCFAEKKGYSKFGSYVGNGNADGPFVYTGFKPSFILIKSTASSTNWPITDDKRPAYNPTNDANFVMYANTSSAESSSSTRGADFNSNGFKIRGTSSDVNGSSNEITYMAFAENPIVGTNNIPATAR